MATRPNVTTAPLTRAKLQMFLGNQPELIRAWESMQRDVSSTLPDSAESLSEQVEQAQADAEQALADAAGALAAANAAQANVDAVEAAPFVTLSASTDLPNERVLSVDAKALSLTDGGPGNPVTLGSADLLAILPADVSDTSGTLTDVTGMQLSLVAGATYVIDALLAFTSAAATTGLALGFTLPAGASIAGLFWHSSTTTTLQGSYNAASGAVAASTTASASAVDQMAIAGRWIVKTAGTAGAAQLQLRTEVAGSAVTLKAGLSALIARRIA